MKIKIYLILFIFIFNINYVFALEIRNVNFSASNNNERWIEVYNNGEDINDFTSSFYKIIDSEDTTKHSINQLLGDISFLKNTSVFISPSTTTPDGVVKSFRSPYKLNKTDGYILLLEGNNQTCFVYGNSICPNNLNNNNNNISTSTNNNSTSTNTQNTNNNIKEVIKYIYLPENNQEKYGDIQVHLPKEKTVTALAENEFTVVVTDSNKQTIKDLSFNFSFGDGGEENSKQEVKHIYTYSGDYILIAEAKGFLGGGKALMNIKVIEPNIEIIKVGNNAEENFIEIKNNTNYDLYLSGFFIKTDFGEYKLPKNLLLSKNKNTKLSGDAIGFNLPSKNVNLLYPNKKVFRTFEYKEKEEVKNEIIATTTSIINNIILNNNEIIKDKQIEIKNEKPLTIINKENKIQNNIKSNNIETIEIKRLILSNNETTIKNKEIFKENNIVSGKAVDIGIITWFKNLLY